MSDEKNESRPDDAEAPETATPAKGEAIRSKSAANGNGNGKGKAKSEPAEKPKSRWSVGNRAAEIEALQAETADLKDKLLRTVAEMENMRRRTERDKADTAKYAISNFARDVLSVGDNIRRAIESVPEDAAASDSALKSLLEGVEMTERELLHVLERHGIARLEPKGERFDPNQHQAMFEIENTEVPAGTVLEVMQAGYIIADRVLRPAMVGVSKGGEKLPKVDAEADADPELDAAIEALSETPKAANDDSPEPADEPDAAKEAEAEDAAEEPEAAKEAAKDDAAGGKADEDAKPEPKKKKKDDDKVGRKVDKSA